MTPTEFLITKMMEGMDRVTQVLLVTRTDDGELTWDSSGNVCTDTLGMLAFAHEIVAEHVRRNMRTG